MTLQTDFGEIALPSDFRLDITAVNPFFGDEGTASMPVTLPPTRENLAIFDHPEIQTRRSGVDRTISGVLYIGPVARPCIITIDSASREDGISVSLAFQVSEIYATLQDKKLLDIFTGWGVNLTTPRNFLQYLDNPSGSRIYFAMFPVAADLDNGSIQTVLNPAYSNTSYSDAASAKGYRYTPFFSLSYLLELTFTMNHLNVAENVFATDSVLKRIIVLNRCADAFVNDSFSLDTRQRAKFKDIVPDITVGDLIRWIRDKFGAVVTNDADGVRIRLFRDLIAEKPVAQDWNLLRAEKGRTVTLEAPANPTMTIDTSLDGAAPADETLEKFRKRFDSAHHVATEDGVVTNALYYVKTLGKYYLNHAMIGTDAWKYVRTIAGISEEEDRSCSDLFVPMVKVDGKYMPYVGKTFRHTDILGDRDPDAISPLMLCYLQNVSNPLRNIGSQYNYSDDGAQLSGTFPPLTPEGMMKAFLSDYQVIRLNAYPQVSCRLRLSLRQLLMLDLCKPTIIDNQRVLFRSLSYTLTDDDYVLADAVFQTLPTYENPVLPPDIGFEAPSYGWRLVNTCPTIHTSSRLVIAGTDGKTDYTDADKPSYTPQYSGIEEKKRERWIHVRSWIWGRHGGWRDKYIYYNEYFISEDV